ncbi:glycosyltransferase [Muribacter muris]|uniref:glycosyltransferase n=1 Tax=Muribacter muris TaxID=67855 RepID=UPI00069E5DBF|nr:glycosyltransferase [Muribacter muris]
MKLIIFNQWLVIGGIEKVLLSYLSIFRQLGYDIELAITYNVDAFPKHFQNELPSGIKTYFCLSDTDSKYFLDIRENKKNSLKSKLRYEYNRIILDRKYKNFCLNILNHNNYDLIIDFSGSLLKLLSNNTFKNINTPIIRWNHSQIPTDKKSLKKYQKSLPKYHKIIAICEEMNNNLIKYFNLPKNKVITISNPINIKTIAQKSQIKTECKYNDKYLIIISRLVEGKGLSELIEIYAKLKEEKGIQHKLCIIGDGYYKNKLESTIQHYHLSNDCYLLGEMDNPYPYLKNADVFVFTSESEGLGMVLIESMALGIPVVAMDCPTGPKEILGSNSEYGKLIPMHNKSLFCDVVIELLENKTLWHHYSQQGLLRSQDFSTEVISRKIDLFFKTIVKR